MGRQRRGVPSDCSVERLHAAPQHR